MTLISNESHGRPKIFTPERMEQIRNLVERGMKREEIAETVGVTLGSLQVTCSRHGISLRRPKPFNGGTLPRRERLMSETPPKPTPSSGEFSLHMTYRGMTRDEPLPIDWDTIGKIALEAQMRGVSLGQLIAKFITLGIARNDV